MRLSLYPLLVGIVLSAAGSCPAAPVDKRPFSHQDFDAWRSITSQTISRDGHYLAYAYMPLEGDGDVIVRDLNSGQEQRVSVGALLPAPLTGSETDPERAAPRRSVTLAITSDSRFAIATLFPTRAELTQARSASDKSTLSPTEGLVVITLASGEVVRLPGVKNFQIPSNGGAWLAYLKTPPAGTAGSDLVLRDLTTSGERMFPRISDYSFSRDGRTLLYTVSSQPDSTNGVFGVTPGDPAKPIALAQGPGRYLRLTWDREQTQAAFLNDRAGTTPSRLAVYHWRRGSAAAAEVLTGDSSDLPPGSVLSSEAPLTFSRDGQKLYVSHAPVPPAPDPRLATMPEDEKIRLDLWRWNDDVIQPLQKVRAEQDRRRAYIGQLDLDSGHYLPLADLALGTLTFNDAGTMAFGLDDRPYRRRFDYDGLYQDLYLVNVATGTRQLVARELGEKATVRWSPDNRWLTYYTSRHWLAVDSRDGSVHTLTQGLPFPFHDEKADMPELPGAYGTPGWTTDGNSLLVYDRYDLWQVFPDGRTARNLTDGFGRKNQIQLRLQRTDAIEPGTERSGIDLDRPLIFRGENEFTRATGFYRITPGTSTPPEQLLWADKDFRYIGRALAADTLLFTASRFDEFPDIWVTDGNFATPRRVSAGGAQLDAFAWGTAGLINYRISGGTELSAMLCKPANFDPQKKYPMIVYIYERLSANVNRFFTPAPLAVIDPSFYTSNGYVVLMPDIAYTMGHPGPSAYRCVMAAVDEVLRLGFVDENALGLEGHSWGGYETAYIITQTNRFRAAEAGAIVVNMISANGAIGDSSGRSRQFKYEKNQSRIGAPITTAPQLYIENSPVFLAAQVNTPLLILHNDHDDVVPWPQAVEFFLALRREGKEVYLLNYNDELHSPRRRAAQKDFARRMHQFFDHFLKGSPAPDWMTQGIPYLDREAEKLRFRDAP